MPTPPPPQVGKLGIKIGIKIGIKMLGKFENLRPNVSPLTFRKIFKVKNTIMFNLTRDFNPDGQGTHCVQ